MKIVIAGDGEVGSTLAGSLQKEDHSVTVIDNNAETLRRSIESLDVTGVRGNAATYSVQTEAGVPASDLFIAAASTDELNILCCMLARKLGAKSTIARLRNPEYIEQIHLLQDDLGLSMSVNPERAAARELAQLIDFPAALNRGSMAGGKVELFEFRVEEAGPLAGRRLSELKAQGIRVLICAVDRDGQAYIPNGDFILRVGDRIHVTGTNSDMGAFLKFCGMKNRRARNVLIVGGGRIGFYLAKTLSERGLSVRIVEKDAARCHELSERLPGVLVVEVDGNDQETLTSEDLSTVDSLVAATARDEQNLIVSVLARHMGVPHVLTKLDGSGYLPILDRIGINSVVIPKITAADMILQYVRAMGRALGAGVKSLHRIIGDQVEILEFSAAASPYLDVPLMSAPLKKNVLVAAIVHNGTLRIPQGKDLIRSGDTIVVVTGQSHFSELNDIFD